MSLISNTIEQFILSILAENGIAELQRNELANHFSCAPSQINYVLSTRFNTNRGYVIESRRGGGGYIRITRLEFDKTTYLKEILSQHLGNGITYPLAESLIIGLLREKYINSCEARQMLAAIADRTLNVPQPLRDNLRASILKAMIISKNNEYNE